MIDGNDSLRPGAGRVPRDQWSACPISFYSGDLSVTSIRIITPSVGPNAPVFCQYLVPVPGGSRGTQFLLVAVHSGKHWRKMDRGKPRGRESLTRICRGSRNHHGRWKGSDLQPEVPCVCLSPPAGTFWGSECGPGLVGHWGSCADPSTRAPQATSVGTGVPTVRGERSPILGLFPDPLRTTSSLLPALLCPQSVSFTLLGSQWTKPYPS